MWKKWREVKTKHKTDTESIQTWEELSIEKQTETHEIIKQQKQKLQNHQPFPRKLLIWHTRLLYVVNNYTLYRHTHTHTYMPLSTIYTPWNPVICIHLSSSKVNLSPNYIPYLYCPLCFFTERQCGKKRKSIVSSTSRYTHTRTHSENCSFMQRVQNASRPNLMSHQTTRTKERHQFATCQPTRHRPSKKMWLLFSSICCSAWLPPGNKPFSHELTARKQRQAGGGWRAHLIMVLEVLIDRAE